MSTVIGGVVYDDVDNDMKIMTDNGLVSIGNVSIDGTIPITNVVMSNTSAQTISFPQEKDVESIMDAYSMNRFAIDHKVTAQELLKLQEVAPDYASEIKENIAKNLARDISKKIMFKKKHDKDADVHHFIGRVWVFTDEEMKLLLKDKNVY
jgi:hypothetical protein